MDDEDESARAPFQELVLDEIGLEGLEGITLPSLWVYLSSEYKCPDIPNNIKNSIWNFIKINRRHLQFYQLPVERETVKIWNRYEKLDPIFGVPLVKDTEDLHRGKFILIDKHGTLGSSASYSVRKRIKFFELKNMSLADVMEKWGKRFIIVGSQMLRWRCLVPQNTFQPDDLTPFQYAVLEAVGRGRYNGETSCGPYSLLQFCNDSSLLFYVKNKLSSFNLILQQPYYEKQNDRITPCYLLTLPKFFKPFKSRIMQVIATLIKEIKHSPELQLSVSEFRKLLCVEHNKAFKKISNLPVFRQFFYIEQPTKARITKAEKRALMVSLRNPEMEPERIFCFQEANDGDVDDDVDENEWEDHFNTNEQAYANMPMREEFLSCIHSFGARGCSHAEICCELGHPHLTVRSVVKTLMEEGYVKTYSVDIGRQRLNMYVTIKNDEKAERLKAETEEILTIRCKEEPNISMMTDDLLNDCESVYGVIKPHIGNMENQTKDIYTQRIINRKKLVIETIDAKCIVPVADLRMLLQKFEKDNGYKDELCLKSIWRLLYSMQSNNLITLYDIFLKYKNAIRTYRYVTHPKISSDNPILKHEMIKLKNALYLIFEEKKTGATKKVSTENVTSPNNSKMANNNAKVKHVVMNEETEKNETMDVIETENDGNTSGCGAKEQNKAEKPQVIGKPVKFPKLLISRYMHELLHYLVYELEQNTNPIDISEDLLYEWQRREPNFQVKSYFEELKNDPNHPLIYKQDINWRTFIPPVPRYDDKPKGWLYLLDVIKRIPLSMLNKIFRIEKEANDNVLEYLMHPVKKHYMLNQIPNILQGINVTRLEMQKVYIMCLKLLQNMGLIQIAIRNYVRDPMVIWVYVNHFAKVVDTRTSEQGYDSVSIDREYSAKEYDFRNAEEITSYWQDLHRVCVYTKLGFKKNKKNRAPPRDKKELGYLEGVNFLDGPNLDNGSIPGNGLGAGGLSSIIYAHVLRHWSWVIQSDIQLEKQVRPARIPVVRSKPRISLNARRSRTFMPKKTQRKPIVALASNKTSSSGPKISARKTGPRDAIDRDALNNMRCLRVKWFKREDEMIKLARAVYLYIAAPVPALGLLTVGKIVRDILRHSLNVKNKTQQACVRRGQFLIKMHRDVPEVTSWLHALQTNPYIQYKYGEDFLKRLKQDYPDRKEYCDALAIHFILIMKLLYQIVYDNSLPNSDSNLLPRFILPDLITEYEKRFEERLSLADEPLLNHKNPKSEHDQHVSVVHGVLHSSLCCARDKTLYILQAFEIYKNYTEDVLQEAFTKARNDSLAIAIKRKNLQLSPTQLAGPAYLLSSKYRMRLIFLKIPYAVYDLFYSFFTKAIKEYFGPKSSKSKDYFELKSPQIGQLILIAEGLSKEFLLPFVKFPVNILNIDAEYKEKCSHMDRIMDHYSSIFANAPTTDYYKNFETEMSDRKSLVKFHPAFLTYKVKYSPFDIISKMCNYHLHFFCALSNLHKTFVIDASVLQHIDDQTNTVVIDCPFDNCVMKSNNSHQYMNSIDRIVHIKRTVIETLKKEPPSSKIFTLSSEPITVILTPQNLLPLVRAFENHWRNIETNFNQKDFGKLSDSAGKRDDDIKWLELCQDILNYKKNDENDFCDEYEPKLNKDEKTIRAQDIFVVNLPTLQFKMNSKWYDSNNMTVPFRGVEVPISLVETDVYRDKMLKKILNESLWKYTENSLTTLQIEESFLTLTPKDQELLKQVHDEIESKKLGITTAELMGTFADHEALSKIIEILANHYLIKRVGVATFMYVHKKYIRSWVIHTFHLKRLEKEKLGSIQPINLKRKATEMAKESRINDEEYAPVSKRVKFGESDPNTESKKRVRKQVRHYGDVEECVAKMEQKEQQRDTIVMKPRPWLRLNGSLNRRVLDRWLGSVLTECIAKSGCFLRDISQRFPQVLPVDIYYLIEILADLKCVRLSEIIKEEVSLFSEYRCIEERSVSKIYDPAHTYIVANADAISRMAIFIGQKKYDVEFI